MGEFLGRCTHTHRLTHTHAHAHTRKHTAEWLGSWRAGRVVCVFTNRVVGVCVCVCVEGQWIVEV